MKQSSHKIPKITSLLLAALLLIALSVVALNQNVHTVHYVLTSPKVTKELRIVMISDLHGSFYGKEQETLLKEIEKNDPHLLLFTGDIFDEDTDHAAAEALFAGVFQKYPCYYITGNHEYVADFKEVREILHRYQIQCLWGEGQTVTVDGQELFLCGIADDNHALYFQTPTLEDATGQFARLEQLRQEHQEYLSVLLCHRPKVSVFEGGGFDLVLSGHNHGGQVRIPPLINGLFSPDEGFFPKHAGGIYTLANGGSLVIGRGLAKNHLPRVFNRPEVVLVEILPES